MRASKTLLRFGIGLIAALIVSTGLFALTSPYYNTVIVQVSSTAIALLEHPRRTVLVADGNQGAVLRRTSVKDIRLAEYSVELYFEVVLFLALLLATPRIRITRKLVLAVIGLGCFVLFHAASLTTFARAVVMGRSTRWVTFFLFAGVALAVLLWALLTFRYWVAWPRGAVPAEPDHAERNDPCPCGSGKKYKWCCGKKK
jgi:hypothetical protein